MRLIVQVDWDVPYEAHGTDTLGVEYESKEKFLFDLEARIHEVLADPKKTALQNSDLIFAGIRLEFYELYYHNRGGSIDLMLPTVWTVDEWFEKELQDRKDTQ